MAWVYIPKFDLCLAELHKSKHYMQGEFNKLPICSESPSVESLSTPINFLVPDIMQSVKEI
ncbi:hypothetical protein CJF42_00315 [Pseudoalteromonas sp. NBT06-2]|nr:hypothetical protein CJF42_00315 [Pseudoalteromonas sp. NBT06-2]